MKKLVISEMLERDLENNNKYIIMTEETYTKTESSKSWKRKPIEVKKENIKAENYANIFNSIEFFKNLGGYEKVTKTYTINGYIPTMLTSISPDKQTKIIRKFAFVR